MALLQAYSAGLDKAKAEAQDPALAKALGDEADIARSTTRVFEATSNANQIHTFWVKYLLNTGKEPAKLCPNEWLVEYRAIEEARATFR